METLGQGVRRRLALASKRIVFLIGSLESGGAERVAVGLCNHWASNGHEVTLVATYSGRAACAFALDRRIKLVILADRLGVLEGTLLAKPARLLKLRAIIRDARPDRIVSFLTHVNVAALVAALGLRVPVIVSERSYPPAWRLPAWLRVARAWSYPLAHSVVMQTDHGLQWLQENIPKAKGTVIPNPVVESLPIGEPIVPPISIARPGRRFILSVGRLEAEKQQTLLIDAFTQIADAYPETDLVILGEGSLRPALETQIARLNLPGRIFLPGQVGNLSEWYARAEAFILTSKVEGFPNALLEAVSFGVPAISIDCPTGPSEILHGGGLGILVAPSDPLGGLVTAIKAVLSGEFRVDQTRVVAVRKRFSIGSISDKWLELDQ